MIAKPIYTFTLPASSIPACLLHPSLPASSLPPEVEKKDQRYKEEKKSSRMKYKKAENIVNRLISIIFNKNEQEDMDIIIKNSNNEGRKRAACYSLTRACVP